jgi:hypothetical protein
MYKQPDIYDEARRRVRKKARFYKHLFFFMVFNGFIFITALADGNPFEPLIVTFFWGIGLAFHYLRVFGIPGTGVLSADWEDREYRRELKQLEKHKKPSQPHLDEQLELKEMAKKYRDSDLV